MFPSTPDRDLAQLHALLAFDRASGWLGRDRLDDQARCLALAYTLKALGAEHVRDLADTCHVQLRAGEPNQSVWVYGFDVDFGSHRVFVGLHGEPSRRAAEEDAALRRHGASPEMVHSRPRWDDQSTAFESLEAARKFYNHDTMRTLQRLVGEGVAHLQATALQDQAPAVDPAPRPGSRL